MTARPFDEENMEALRFVLSQEPNPQVEEPIWRLVATVDDLQAKLGEAQENLRQLEAQVRWERKNAAAMQHGADLELASRTLGKLEAIDEENRLTRLIVALWQGGEALLRELDQRSNRAYLVEVHSAANKERCPT